MALINGLNSSETASSGVYKHTAEKAWLPSSEVSGESKKFEAI